MNRIKRPKKSFRKEQSDELDTLLVRYEPQIHNNANLNEGVQKSTKIRKISQYSRYFFITSHKNEQKIRNFYKKRK